jgi:hypothetical protein
MIEQESRHETEDISRRIRDIEDREKKAAY